MGDARGNAARASRRGGALVFALAAVVVVVGLSASFLQVASAVTQRQARSVEQKQAFYLAEAGLTEAFYGLTVGKTGNVGSEEAPAVFGNGLFWVEAEELVEGGPVRLESTGMAGGANAALSIVVEPGSLSVASLGFFGDGGLDVLPGSVIDGYDSSLGTYEEQNPEPEEESGGLLGGGLLGDASGSLQEAPQPVPAPLGSNGSITVSGTPELPTEIHGDVSPGPEGTLDVVGEVTITGSTDPRIQPAVLPPVTVPEVEQEPGIDHSGGQPIVVGPGTVGLQHLRVAPDAEAILEGPVTLVVGSLDLQAGASLALDSTSGVIRVYVTEGLRLAAGSFLGGSSGEEAFVAIQVDGETQDPVQLLAESGFRGVVYAPEADVQVASEFEVFGSLVGKQLTFVGPARLHFDRMLAAAAAEAGLPRQVSWRLLELGNQPGGAGGDPFDILGLLPTAGSPPAVAHEPVPIDITYEDLGGSVQTWQGMEDLFDWSDVQEVLYLARDGEEVNTKAGEQTHYTREADPGLLNTLQTLFLR